MKAFYRFLLLALCSLLASCSTYRGVDYVVDGGVGVPKRRYFHHEKLVKHSNYCSLFNKKRMQPTWVAWTLTAEETKGILKRSNNFQPDRTLKAKLQVTTHDYKNSGFDRGHLCPAADNKFSQQAMDECFLMTNMCPQLHELNAGGWESLEDSCRVWAQREDSIVVVAGPIFFKKRPSTIGTQHKVAVPDAFFKIVLSMRPGKEKAIGFLFTNSNLPQPVDKAACSVRQVEKVTKLNFFPRMSKKKQRAIESNFDLSDWHR